MNVIQTAILVTSTMLSMNATSHVFGLASETKRA